MCNNPISAVKIINLIGDILIYSSIFYQRDGLCDEFDFDLKINLHKLNDVIVG